MSQDRKNLGLAALAVAGFLFYSDYNAKQKTNPDCPDGRCPVPAPVKPGPSPTPKPQPPSPSPKPQPP